MGIGFLLLLFRLYLLGRGSWVLRPVVRRRHFRSGRDGVWFVRNFGGGSLQILLFLWWNAVSLMGWDQLNRVRSTVRVFIGGANLGGVVVCVSTLCSAVCHFDSSRINTGGALVRNVCFLPFPRFLY